MNPKSPLDYVRMLTPKMGQLTALQNKILKPQTFKFAEPKSLQDIARGRSNAQEISKLPKSTRLY